MGALMKEKRNWTIAKCQKPPSAHIVLNDSNVDDWQDLADSIKYCTKLMKENPELNKNEMTALYGMTG